MYMDNDKNNFNKDYKICLGLLKETELSPVEQIKMLNKIGFDAFFTGWDDNLKIYREVADSLGMIYQSVHAPFGYAAKMWEKGSEAEKATLELVECVRDCGGIQVPLMVVHPYIGFENEYIPNKDGVENFRVVVEEAKEQNVKIAFENVEGEEYLKCLMDTFRNYENVGFCWDSGHELCYNRGKDMLELYGDRLIATHLNDNLGVSNGDGKIFWTDDLHLLPFDGINNWENIANRLNKFSYDGILTFELTRKSKPDRHENDKYEEMKLEDYLTEVYARAQKLVGLLANN